jgi:hypothetical protein
MTFDGFVPLDIWKMSTPKERQPVRDLAIAEFFAAAAGTDILDHIPAERRKEVVGAFLDALGVDGMREAMPPELSAALRARQPVNLTLRLRELDLGAAAHLMLDAFGNRFEMIVAKTRELRAPKGRKSNKAGKSEIPADLSIPNFLKRPSPAVRP